MSGALVNDFGLQAEIHRGFVRFFAKRGMATPVVKRILEDEPAFKKWARECLRRDQQFYRVERAIT